MKPIQFSFFYAALVLAVLTAGCAKPPTEEMNNAIEAVIRAENDRDAVTYARNSLERARDALARMHAEADSKHYDQARSFASEAIAAADRAITEGRAGAARAREEAASIVSQLRPLMAETEQGINAARAAGLPLNFVSLDRDFDMARLFADEAQNAFSGERYQDAIDQGRTARSRLSDINQQLSNVVVTTIRMK
jgi:hypothetical protein